ncbi:MAG TPA: nucleotide exchange factor GrpE [Candidatus Aminicenantes bacterium]|nr:nucleotide exchange factor GrpE [Candidatus Aminicenantes bacterium]
MPKNKDLDPTEVGYVPQDNEDDHAAESEHHHKPRQSSPHGTAELRRKISELEQTIEKQQTIINQVRQERDDFQDKFLRNLAEMDNFRKRIGKEKEEYQRFVLGEFLLSLLEIYDNFERAIRAHTSDESPRSILSGVQMIFKQLQELLRKYRVEELNPYEHPFDPNFHQALSKEERDNITDPLVVEVYQKGFLYNEKLLRPALVRVAIPPAETTNHNGEED